MLFALTRKSDNMGVVNKPSKLSWSVYVGILLLICLGAYEVLATVYRTKRWHKRRARLYVPAPGVQVSIWFVLMIAAVLTWTILSACVGLVILLTAQLIPFRLKKRPSSLKMGG